MEYLETINEIERSLTRWLWWARFRRSVEWSLRGLALGLGSSLALCLLAVLRGLLLSEEYIFILAVSASLGLLGGFILGFLWPFPRMKAARYFDRVFGLRERVSTALEIGRKASREDSEMMRRQAADALAVSRRVQPPHSLPIKIIRWEWLAIGVLVLAGLVIWAKGASSFQAALQKRTVQAVILSQAKQIESILSGIETDQNLSGEQRDSLARPLEEALKTLNDAGSQEQALSALQSAQAKLQSLSDPQALEKAQALQNAGNNLSQQGGSPLESFGNNLSKGDILSAAQKLGEIDPGSLSDAERQALASQLEESAGTIGESNPDLAKKMRQAASALREGDVQSAGQALQQAAQSLAETGQQIHQAQVAGEVSSQLAESSQQVIQSGQSAQKAQANAGQNGNPQSGQEPGNSGSQGGSTGQNGSQGQGSSSQTGQNGGSSGAGRGEGIGAASQGPEAGNQPIQGNNGPGDGGERAYEPIYSPQRLGGAGGEDVTLPSSGEPREQTPTQGNTTPGTPGNSTVPYVEVLPFYEQAYREAIDSGQVPVSLRELVKKYFSSLEP